MKISQETYDETIIENEELFSLSTQKEAIEETISQFQQQGITQLDSYLVTSHPLSDVGKVERMVRSDFVSLLDRLDSFVSDSGEVVLIHTSDGNGNGSNDNDNDNDNTSSNDNDNDNNADNCMEIVNTIEKIHQYCRHGTSTSTITSNTNANATHTDTHDDNTTNNVYNNNPIPFLTLAHSTSSLYTVMNLLSVIPFPSPTSPPPTSSTSSTTKPTTLSTPTKQQTKILQSTLKLLITMTCPTNTNEKDIKLIFKDSFVCMDRMVGLIVYYMTLLLKVQHQHQYCVDNDDNDTDDTSTSIVDHTDTLSLIIKCIMNACKNCEKNKVLFVRCLKSTCVSPNVELLIHNYLTMGTVNTSSSSTTISSSTSKNDSGDGVNDEKKEEHAATETEMKKKKESTIGILAKLITLILTLHNHHQSTSSSSTTSTTSTTTTTTTTSLIQTMTDCCKLIAVLCRFDDFRSTSESNTVDSSYGGVSSAHDHVLEFNREGIIPSLHELILLSFDDSDDNDNGNENGNSDSDNSGNNNNDRPFDNDRIGLAAAAMSATRVLAVNDEIVQALVAIGILKSVKVALDMGVVESDVEIVNVEDVNANDVDVDNADVDVDVDADIDVDNAEKKDQNDNNNDKKMMMRTTTQRQQLTSGAIGLIRNICGNDEIKTTICLGSDTNRNTTTVPSVLPSILQGMSIYKKSSTVQEHGCGTLAAMALRKPLNALRILQEGGASSILTAMKLFPNNVLVQRQGALAVRNIVSRLVANTSALDAMQGEGGGDANQQQATEQGTEAEAGAGTVEGQENNENPAIRDNVKNNDNNISVRDIFLDLGAEVILRGITGRHQGSVDEAYAALRDLGCQVSMLKYDAEKQTTTTRVAMFGDVKPQFRPVYEESK